MAATIIDGKAIAARISDEVTQRIRETGITPGLAVLLVGDDPASHLYVGLKEKACKKAGIRFRKTILPAHATETEAISSVQEYNHDPSVHAILVQIPLPDQMNEGVVVEAIDPAKDVDGFHPVTISDYLRGRQEVMPVLARTVRTLVTSTGIDCSRKASLVIGNSDVLGNPLLRMLEDLGTDAHFLRADDVGVPFKALAADVLVVAAGRPHMITGKMLKPGAVVIDIGTTRVGGKVLGDVEPGSAREVAGFLTPVPGGVGPVTVATLLQRTLELAEQQTAAP